MQFKREEILLNLDLFKEIGLEIPFILKLISNLNSRNIKFEKYTEEEILEKLGSL